jgi:hypothetical protein
MTTPQETPDALGCDVEIGRNEEPGLSAGATKESPAKPLLADEPDLLDQFLKDLKAGGFVGEGQAACLVFLAAVSRRLDAPVSIAVKGPSASGKSMTVARALAFVRPSAYHALTSMSERALIYDTTPMAHRVLVMYEYQGMIGDMPSYLIRSLLSEGRIRYQTVEKTPKGLVPRLIEREGPTGLIVTTTAAGLHPENETRVFSVSVTDTPEQTSAIMLAQAEARIHPDLTAWHELDEWLDSVPADVVIPFARDLATLIPGIAVRMRRDFPRVLSLIRAHAILHAGSRERDRDGRVIAAMADYRAVAYLVSDLLAEGVDQTVKPETRAVVVAVQRLTGGRKSRPATGQAVAAELHLDKSAASRRIALAIAGGFVRNLENKRGQPQRLVIGEPMPADVVILPDPATVARLHGHRRVSEASSMALAPAPVRTQIPLCESATVQPAGPRHDLVVDLSRGDCNARVTDPTSTPAHTVGTKSREDRLSHVDCYDYRGHQLAHVWANDGWVCTICAPSLSHR